MKQENGKKVEVEDANVLYVITSGLELFRKEFIEGDKKFSGKNQLVCPFDFVALAGDLCPEGRFYEMEYTLGGPHGVVYRGLIQAVNPCTDIRLVLGTLIARNYIPQDIYPRKAWLRDDIDAVCQGDCFRDEDNTPMCGWGTRYAKDSDISVSQYVEKYHDAVIYYYRGDHREPIVKSEYADKAPKIFVCGSENVNDPEFLHQREADMEELANLLSEAKTIIQDYNVPHFLVVATDVEGDSTAHFDIAYNLNPEHMRKIVDAVYKDKE